ncbi:glutamate-cysteine ligase family protein [Sciscionella sediminilitoris]|uniref:glutamate-cysteine ligase family protein n=1 Tax=Sciscionella sediminilitoris TaxID=1445613 RepID=UPI0004DFA2EB|nr:glutamate-cysteine ligase family protein [Sciscionella sp. SE31]
MISPDTRPRALRTRAEAEAYVASICFKHGPPRRYGLELEWTVHHAEDPAAALDPARLRAALGESAPATLSPGGPARPLPSGCQVTVEPGGQVELSSPAEDSVTALFAALSADFAELGRRCTDAGLVLGEYGLDPYRPARRLLRTPRYAAMEAAFEPFGGDGKRMMCSTAGVQVCVDMGERDRVERRWECAHAMGPALCALFGNTAPGADAVSGRQLVVFGSDPVRMRPAEVGADPAMAWAHRVLEAPVMCVRSLGDRWIPPRPLSFAAWIDGALEPLPTTDDLDYHLSTMFPPVRPHGYLELRYIDAQAGSGWLAPALLLIALLGTDTYTERALEAARPAAGMWLDGARSGLADPVIAEAAAGLVAIGAEAIEHTDIEENVAAQVIEQLRQRLNTFVAG